MRLRTTLSTQFSLTAVLILLTRYERETLHQIAVLTIPSLLGESIESFSLRVANSWRIGHKDFNDGILVTLAMKERKVRIELGLGMEKFITNATAQSIIETSMIPAFRKNDYAGGLERGLEQLMKEARKFVINSELKRSNETMTPSRSNSQQRSK